MSASFDISHSFCRCKIRIPKCSSQNARARNFNGLFMLNFRGLKLICRAGVISNREFNGNLHERISPQALRNNIVLSRVSKDEEGEEEQEDEESVLSQFKSYEEDPMVGKLRTQLGVIHPIPSPPINKNVVGLLVVFFFVGVFFDKIWTGARNKVKKFYGFGAGNQSPQVPTSFSMLLEKDLQRKESVEWVNMVLGKLWKVYRSGIENWIVGLLQPVIDNLEKPEYVQRVLIKQFSLGDEPLSVRSVERRTSRRVNDLQYQIGLRYTGGARLLLMLTLNFGIIPITVPVGVRDFDIDGELWVKLRLIETEPWVGAVQWAFVTLPKIKFELSPFRLFNLMGIPLLSMFLTKLLTEDLPRLFVRPKKIVLDFEKGTAVAKSGDLGEGNRDFVGELSVTLVDARELFYVFYAKTDPYVILKLGDQVIRSKKNSQTTVIGPPGQPIWNQDFHMLVANHRKQKLIIQVKDSLGFTDFTVGTGEIDLGSLQDTVPTDRVVVLRGGIKTFGKGTAGELLLRLTYKAYVEDEDDVPATVDLYTSDDESSDLYELPSDSSKSNDKESFIGLLAALIVSEEFQGIVASDAGNNKGSDNLANPLANEKTSSPNELTGLVWFAVLTAMFVVVAITMDNSNYFNH